MNILNLFKKDNSKAIEKLEKEKSELKVKVLDAIDDLRTVIYVKRSRDELTNWEIDKLIELYGKGVDRIGQIAR